MGNVISQEITQTEGSDPPLAGAGCTILKNLQMGVEKESLLLSTPLIVRFIIADPLPPPGVGQCAFPYFYWRNNTSPEQAVSYFLRTHLT